MPADVHALVSGTGHRLELFARSAHGSSLKMPSFMSPAGHQVDPAALAGGCVSLYSQCILTTFLGLSQVVSYSHRSSCPSRGSLTA